MSLFKLQMEYKIIILLFQSNSTNQLFLVQLLPLFEHGIKSRFNENTLRFVLSHTINVEGNNRAKHVICTLQWNTIWNIPTSQTVWDVKIVNAKLNDYSVMLYWNDTKGFILGKSKTKQESKGTCVCCLQKRRIVFWYCT